MKRLLILTLLLSSPSFAQLSSDCKETDSVEVVTGQYDINTKVPKCLKNATITVKQEDGKTYTIKSEEFKVVPRKQQFITKTVEKTKTITCDEVVVRKNRISLVGGAGPKPGFNTTRPDANTVSVENNAGLVLGLQYQRQISSRFSVGIQGQTNKTGSLLLGVDF